MKKNGKGFAALRLFLLAFVCAASVFAASRLNVLEPVVRSVLGAARDAEVAWRTYSWAQAAPDAGANNPSAPPTFPGPASTATPLSTGMPAPAQTETTVPASTPSPVPAPSPTQTPAHIPVKVPTPAPTRIPKRIPSQAPTPAPTQVPSPAPTVAPTIAPTETPPPASMPPSPTPSSPSPTPSPTPAQQIVRHVSSRGANVRSGPSTDHDRIETLSQGDAVIVLDGGSGGWLRIETPSGAVGYISEKLLSD